MSPQRRNVLAYYRAYWKAAGSSPPLHAALAHLGGTRQNLHLHLTALVTQGYLAHLTAGYRPTRKALL